MPNTCCCVPLCSNRGGHTFPKDPALRKEWVLKVRRHKWVPSNSSVVCFDHFTSEDYITSTWQGGYTPLKRMLKKMVVPSVFSWTKTEISTKAKERRERYVKRGQLGLPVTIQVGLQHRGVFDIENKMEAVETEVDVDLLRGTESFGSEQEVDPLLIKEELKEEEEETVPVAFPPVEGQLFPVQPKDELKYEDVEHPCNVNIGHQNVEDFTTKSTPEIASYTFVNINKDLSGSGDLEKSSIIFLNNIQAEEGIEEMVTPDPQNLPCSESKFPKIYQNLPHNVVSAEGNTNVGDRLCRHDRLLPIEYVGNGLYKCKLCCEFFLSLNLLREHSCGNEGNIACEVSDRNTSDRNDKKKYTSKMMSSFTDGKEYPDQVTRDTNHKKKRMSTIKNSFTNDKEHLDKVTSDTDHKNSTRVHCSPSLSHSKEYPFTCLFCNKGFSWNEELKKHSLIHAEGCMHTCYICKTPYRTFSQLVKFCKTYSNNN